MRVLIFGVTGNSGRFIADHFYQKGYEVWGVGRRNNLKNMNYINYFQGDITDKNLFIQFKKEFEIVVNLAGIQPSIMETSEKTDINKTLRQYVNTNILGTYNVLEYVMNHDVETYIYTTTHRDYELYWDNETRLKNSMPPAINYKGDHAMYAISKVTGQMMGDYMIPLSNTRLFNLRLPMIFMIPESPYYLSNGKKTLMPFLKIIKAAIKEERLEIWGDPGLKRDYVYIENLTRIIDCCIKSGLKTGIFSVGTGEGVTTEDFVKSIAKVFAPQKSFNFDYCPNINTYKCAVYDISEQIKLLNYEPILLSEMLSKMKKKLYKEKFLQKWGWN